MNKKVIQLLVDNTSGVLSRISNLFSRRGYNIESITAGVTADPRFTRITIVTSVDNTVLEQIEKQVEKLVDVRNVKVLEPDSSVYRELCLVKVACNSSNRNDIMLFAENIFHGKIVDVTTKSIVVEVTGKQTTIEAFLNMLDGYEILELARTGITGLSRGYEDVVVL